MAMPRGGDKELGDKVGNTTRQSIFDMANKLVSKNGDTQTLSEEGNREPGSTSDWEKLLNSVDREPSRPVPSGSAINVDRPNSHMREAGDHAVAGPAISPLEMMLSTMNSMMQSQRQQSAVMQQIGSTLNIVSKKLTVCHSPEPGSSEALRDIPEASGSKQSRHDSESRDGDHGYSDVSEDECGSDLMDTIVSKCTRDEQERSADTNDDIGAVNKLVEELHEFFGDDEEVSDSIHHELAKSVNEGLLKPPKLGKLKTIMDRYKRPRNCEALQVPKANEEIWGQARSVTRTRDIKAQQTQGLMVKAMMPLVGLTDALMTSVLDRKELNVKAVIQQATDAIRLLAGAHAEFNSKRRESFRQDLSGPYKKLCNTTASSAKYLFGDDVTKQIKEITESNQIGKKMSVESGKQKTVRGGHRYEPYYMSDQRPKFRSHGYGKFLPGRGGKSASRGRGYINYGSTQQGNFLSKRPRDPPRK